MSNTIPKCPPQEVLDSMKDRWIIDTEAGTITDKRTGRNLGCLRGGYAVISNVHIHHIIWWAHYGKWPDQQLDHRDRVRTNNRISNLRKASSSLQMHNKKMPERDLPQGVFYCPRMRDRKFRARIQVNNQIENHYFHTADEAAKKYQELKQRVLNHV